MKTPEEIKKLKEGLKICSSDECHGDHGDCPYKNNVFCITTMAGEALAYIKRLEERISLNSMRDAIYEDAVAHGLWDEKDGPYHCADIIAKESSELIKEAEHLSIHIHGSIDYTSPRSNYAEELADVIIASLSVAGKLGIDIAAAVRRKMEINRARPWKHGKEPACNT